jgi:hypothetical protein
MMNDDMKKALRGNTLCSDGAAHDRTRKVDERCSYTAVIGCDRRDTLRFIRFSIKTLTSKE